MNVTYSLYLVYKTEIEAFLSFPLFMKNKKTLTNNNSVMSIQLWFILNSKNKGHAVVRSMTKIRISVIILRSNFITVAYIASEAVIILRTADMQSIKTWVPNS